jgi:hypothetical protein
MQKFIVTNKDGKVTIEMWEAHAVELLEELSDLVSLAEDYDNARELSALLKGRLYK